MVQEHVDRLLRELHHMNELKGEELHLRWEELRDQVTQLQQDIKFLQHHLEAAKSRNVASLGSSQEVVAP